MSPLSYSLNILSFF